MTPPTTSDAGIQDAARHLAEGRPADAVAVLERIAGDVPAYVTAHVLLAKAYEADGRPLDALDAWHHAYFLLPGSPLIVRERTRLLRTAPVPEPSDETWQPPVAPPTSPEPTVDAEENDGAEDDDMESAPTPEPEARTASAPDAADTAEAAEETVAGASLLGEVDDLDTLIHQLENAPRIRPDANFKAEGLEEEEDDEGLVSETLARIYVAQRQFGAAARAYEQLAELHPDRADEFEAEAAAMRRREAESS